MKNLAVIPVAQIKQGKRFRKDLGGVEGLAESINSIGLLHPLVVRSDYSLVAGARRLAAIKSLKWETVPVHIVSGLSEAVDLLQAERDENTCRKDFCVTEAVALAVKLEELEKPKAAERRARTQGRPKKGQKKTPADSAAVSETRDVVAAGVGLGRDKLKKAMEVIAAAQADPELQPVLEEMDRTGNVSKAAREVKRSARKKKIEAIKAAPKKPTTAEPPSLILADPPWQYDFSETTNREIENQYPSATLAEICKHKPKSQPNCVLLLWATAPKLLEALKVMDSWGFEYKTNAVWDKEVKGMGYWFRGQHELLLVGVRGKVAPPADFLRVGSVFSEKRGKHSKKPECVFKWVESAFPEEEKLEMYCREPREGWQSWGNEI